MLEYSNYIIWLCVFLYITFYYYHFSSWYFVGLTFVLLIVLQIPPLGYLIFLSVVLVGFVRPIRRWLVSFPIVFLVKKFNLLPKISDTEREALRAGSVWLDAEIFSGRPNLQSILQFSYQDLTKTEKSFLNKQVANICQWTNDWEVSQKRDIPKKVWDYLKKEKFLGIIIPKKYGGLGFSATAHSAIVEKLASRSYPLAITVMVPNSLGPAELLMHYGTEEQKQYYLPRLASGKEIPCFALTEPHAGSDAAAIRSSGEVFKKKNKLFLRLNWDKRYITLAAVSTLLGLAFRLRDPEGLLNKGEDLGITCALVPTTTAGVILGKRHDPLGVPFYNCPTQGKNVEIPLDAVIGGSQGIGKGWKMLMECLAAGRGISLPATSLGSSKLSTAVTTAYVQIRKQFGTEIGNFTGIETLLAENIAYTYLMEANRKMTVSAIDRGFKPPVITAIAKYYFTEFSRKIINHSMDILGGAAISKGPRNLLANPYMATPIGITVEGANILTHSLIIFGQGAIRCHKYLYYEVEALEQGNIKQFDIYFWKHFKHVVTNFVRGVLLSLTRGFSEVGVAFRPNGRYYRKIMWISTAFALLADVSLGLLGGTLKKREKINAKFADILSWSYFLISVLRKYEAEGYDKNDKLIVEWLMATGFYQIQKSFDHIHRNLTGGVIGFFLKTVLAFYTKLNALSAAPKDKLEQKMVLNFLQTPAQREKLLAGIYVPAYQGHARSKSKSETLAKLEYAVSLLSKVTPIATKLKKAMRKKQLPKTSYFLEILTEAKQKQIINQQEYKMAKDFEELRTDIIQVDSFTLEQYQKNR